MRLFISALVAACLFLAPVAQADDGVTGVVTSIALLRSSSDQAATYTGRVIFPGSIAVFWGGSRCPSSTYPGATTSDIAVMMESKINGIVIDVLYKTVGSYKCFVGVIF